MLRYHHPPGVQHRALNQRPLLTTAQHGQVAMDDKLLALWQAAEGQTLAQLTQTFAHGDVSPLQVAAALACLAEAGLLTRETAAAIETTATAVSPATTGPLVSVIIVSYNSRPWLAECLPSLVTQTHTALEIIVVDNGSPDDTDAWCATHYPQVRRLRLPPGHSLAHALNQGAALATGEHLLLLNPDVVLAPDAVAQMVQVAQAHPKCGAVAPCLRLAWAPAFLNGLGNYVREYSWGSDNALGHLDLGQFATWTTVPSACFAAVLIPRAAWLSVGPIDEDFPMYYEDVEWSYRARLVGYTLQAAPQAYVYHAFGSPTPGQGPAPAAPLSPRKLQHVIYGRWRFVLKIVRPPHLYQFTQNYAREDLTNAFNALKQGDWATVGAYLRGWWAVIWALPALYRARTTLYVRVPNAPNLFDAQPQRVPPVLWQGLPELTWERVCTHYLPFCTRRTRPMPEFAQRANRLHLLIVSQDVVDVKMAGPGMRYLEMARALTDIADVTLAVPAATTLTDPQIHLVQYDEARPQNLQVLVENSDIVLISGYMIEKFPFLQHAAARVVVDLYDPFVFENLHYYLGDPLPIQENYNRVAVDVTNKLARVGDFFICGNTRQRDLWLGVLAANGRINPRTFAQDANFNALIDVVTIGLPDRPLRARPLVRGVHPACPPESRIVLWGGGIWNWLDPLTLVRAWPLVLAQHPEARLVFLGTRHPNPAVPRHAMADQTEALAAEIGEKDRTIVFYEWLSYEDREALLAEAEVGVALHPVHVETRYAIRTRVLDYIWAGLPILVTAGDVTSEWVQQHALGQVVAPQDAAATAQALIALLDKPKSAWEPAFAAIRAQLTWYNVVAPLRNYCRAGAHAPDRAQHPPTPPPAPAPAPGLLTTALHVWHTQGLRAMLRRTWQFVRDVVRRL